MAAWNRADACRISRRAGIAIFGAFELAKQIRRAATSIPANVAEGHERRGKAYLNHVRIALGSLAELETHIEVALRLQYVTTDAVTPLLRDAKTLGKMLHALRRSLLRRIVSKLTVTTAVAIAVAMLLP